MRFKKWLSITMLTLLLFNSLPLGALASGDEEFGRYIVKDEVVYANLDASGQMKDMYVVNSFDVTKAGKIIDHGEYIHLRNLTDLTTITQKEHDEVHFQAEKGKFFYQGELEDQPLPWDIRITYVLDGEEMHAKELPGKDGRLEIRIETSANEHVNPLFAENFLLQVSLTLDPEIFQNIQAPKGVEANEGKNKQITFSVLPGQEEVLIVSAYVTALEMDPINIAAVPANIAIEDPDFSELTGGMGTLANAIKDLNAGVLKLYDGTQELNNGALALAKGSSSYQSGINTIDQSSNSLVGGSSEIRDALRTVSQALADSPDFDIPELEQLKEIPESLRRLAKELDAFSPILKQISDELKELPSDIDEEQLSDLYELLKAQDFDEQILIQLERAYEISQSIKEFSQYIPEDFGEVFANLSGHIETLADQFEEGLKELDRLEDLAELQDGLMRLSSEYEQFHLGLVSYTSGVHSLATSYGEINTGINGLSAGAASLNKGVGELYEGTKELSNQTSNLPEEMQSNIEEFMEAYDFSGFEPASFVSEQNEHPGVVQFVLQTERIKIEEPEKEAEVEETPKSLWTRFLDLFR